MTYNAKNYRKQGGEEWVIGGRVVFLPGSKLMFGDQELKITRGQHETVTASDEVDTGLSVVISAVANLDADPTADALFATASIGDQDGSPDAGSILINTWQGDASAASTFGKAVNWIAIGY